MNLGPSRKTEYAELEKKYADAVEEIRGMETEIDKQVDLISKLKAAKDADAVKVIVTT